MGLDLGSLKEYMELVLFVMSIALGGLQVPFMQFLKTKIKGLEDRNAKFISWGIASVLALLGMFLANYFVGMEMTFVSFFAALSTLKLTSETLYQSLIRDKS